MRYSAALTFSIFCDVQEYSPTGILTPQFEVNKSALRNHFSRGQQFTRVSNELQFLSAGCFRKSKSHNFSKNSCKIKRRQLLEIRAPNLTQNPILELQTRLKLQSTQKVRSNWKSNSMRSPKIRSDPSSPESINYSSSGNPRSGKHRRSSIQWDIWVDSSVSAPPTWHNLARWSTITQNRRSDVSTKLRCLTSTPLHLSHASLTSLIISPLLNTFSLIWRTRAMEVSVLHVNRRADRIKLRPLGGS